MQRILFVTGNLGKGGAQRVITLLANAYAQKGWSTHIAALEKMKVSYEISNDISIHTLKKKGSNFRSIPIWIKGLRQIIKTVSPDIIVSFVGRVNLITMLASGGLQIPVVLSERNDPQYDRRSKPEQWLCKAMYPKATKVVFQTNYQKEYYGKACAGNGVIVGNPIAAEEYNGAHESSDIICVGKLMAQKNHKMMISAFSRIAEKHPETNVHIYGEGQERSALQSMIDSAGLNGRVILEGNCDAIFEVLQKNKYFVMCSDYEGLSNALLEAMISGMICVSTDWNGVEDVIQHGKNGYITPRRDDAKLAELLDQLLSNNNMSNITTNAIETAAKYKLNEIIKIWFEEVESCIF